MGSAGSGLRRLIGLLLVLNVGVLLAGWAGARWFAKPATLVTFNADKIRLLEEALPERSVDEAAGDAPAQQTDASGLPLTVPAEPTAGANARVDAAGCSTWKSLDANRLQQIQAHLRGLSVPDSTYDVLVDMRLGWWVYVPPLADADALRAMMDDARGKGVTDMAPVRGGRMNNALALGTFPGMEDARKHADLLAAKGVQGVVFGPRPGAGVARLVGMNNSAAFQKALAAPWPAGLVPDGCEITHQLGTTQLNAQQ